MKRFFLAIAAVLVAFPAFAAETVTCTTDSKQVPAVDRYTCDLTADASGYYTTTTHLINIVAPGFLMQMVTDPGSTAPTDNYDVALNDNYGVDAMGGGGADRDTANTEQTAPIVVTGGTTYGERYVDTPLSLIVSGNAVNAATTKVIVWIRRIVNP